MLYCALLLAFLQARADSGPGDSGATDTAATDTATDTAGDTAASHPDTASTDTGVTDTAADSAPTDSADTDTAATDVDGDGIPAASDCDDGDPAVGAPVPRFHDRDGDGFGQDPDDACPAEAGYVDDASGCDDTDPLVNPAATETCDGVDDDCDGLTDDDSAVDRVTWHLDADDDHYGDAAWPLTACDRPDGYTSSDTDCDDTDPTVNPGAVETCDGVDDNCDGLTDDASATGTTTYYADEDGDTYGDATTSTTACSPPEGYVTDSTDCDDVHDTVGPPVLLYRDHDGDSFGDPTMGEYACPQVIDHVADDTDCNDYDATIYPGADDPPDDGIDQNCDGVGGDSGGDTSPDSGGSADSNAADSGDTGPDGYYAGSSPCGCASPGLVPGGALSALLGFLVLARRTTHRLR